MVKKISILGCGWLGLPLGKRLVLDGWQVKGSTTHKERLLLLETAGIHAFQLSLEPAPLGNGWEYFLDASYLVICIPPKTAHQEASFHLRQLEVLIELSRGFSYQGVVFTSATSVYPEQNQVADEESPIEAEHVLSKAEQLLREAFPQLTILRCGGLMGYNRMAGKYVAGKKGISNGKTPVNFIHRLDVIEIICQLIQQQQWGKTYNAVAPLHPSRYEVYLRDSQLLGLEPPDFDLDVPTPPYKTVSVNKLMLELGYTFYYPDPLEFPFEPQDN
jgi:nucleoside-diphosphate-sugar epimerase